RGSGRKAEPIDDPYLDDDLLDELAEIDPYAYREAFSYRYGYGSGYGSSDSQFLGVEAAVVKASKRRQSSYYYYVDVEREAREALREALDRSLSGLPLGAFHTWDSVLEHLATGRDNPLLLGMDTEQVLISVDGRMVPSLEGPAEAAAKVVLGGFL